MNYQIIGFHAMNSNILLKVITNKSIMLQIIRFFKNISETYFENFRKKKC